MSNVPNAGVTIQKVEVPEASELKQEYVDTSFWKIDKEPSSDDVDSLLAELED